MPDNVNRVLDGKRDDTTECKFCSFTHPMNKEKCPAWGKVCNKCGKLHHFESKCHETSNKSRFGRRSSQGRKQHKRYADKGRVNHVDESSSSDDCNREWCNCISTPHKKSVKCKMLVAGQEVTFLIDTGAVTVCRRLSRIYVFGSVGRYRVIILADSEFVFFVVDVWSSGKMATTVLCSHKLNKNTYFIQIVV